MTEVMLCDFSPGQENEASVWLFLGLLTVGEVVRPMWEEVIPGTHVTAM